MLVNRCVASHLSENMCKLLRGVYLSIGESFEFNNRWIVEKLEYLCWLLEDTVLLCS